MILPYFGERDIIYRIPKKLSRFFLNYARWIGNGGESGPYSGSVTLEEPGVVL